MLLKASVMERKVGVNSRLSGGRRECAVWETKVIGY